MNKIAIGEYVLREALKILEVLEEEGSEHWDNDETFGAAVRAGIDDLDLAGTSFELIATLRLWGQG